MKIKFSKVSKKFGETVALQEVSFKIKEGEFVFITGPSGAGKTTIIKLILGEIFPSSGEVKVGRLTLANKGKVKRGEIRKLRRKIGVIFQDFQLLEECTVGENIRVALEILGFPSPDQEKEVAQVLKKVGLEGREDFFPAQLSGGELQRVCLARALAMKPAVILADEPTGNLDPKNSWQLIELLDKINQEGTTVIMATHNFDIVDSLKKRVLKLADGCLVADEKKGGY